MILHFRIVLKMRYAILEDYERANHRYLCPAHAGLQIQG